MRDKVVVRRSPQNHRTTVLTTGPRCSPQDQMESQDHGAHHRIRWNADARLRITFRRELAFPRGGGRGGGGSGGGKHTLRWSWCRLQPGSWRGSSHPPGRLHRHCKVCRQPAEGGGQGGGRKGF